MNSQKSLLADSVLSLGCFTYTLVNVLLSELLLTDLISTGQESYSPNDGNRMNLVAALIASLV